MRIKKNLPLDYKHKKGSEARAFTPRFGWHVL